MLYYGTKSQVYILWCTYLLMKYYWIYEMLYYGAKSQAYYLFVNEISLDIWNVVNWC